MSANIEKLVRKKDSITLGIVPRPPGGRHVCEADCARRKARTATSHGPWMSAPVGRTPESRPRGTGLKPFYSLRSGEWLSGSSQAHSAARCLVSPPQEARIASWCTRTGRALPTCCGTILLQVHEQHRAEQRGREDRHKVQHLEGNDEALRHRRPRRRLGQAPRLRAGPEAAVALPWSPEGSRVQARARLDRGWATLPLPARRVLAVLAHPEKL